MAGRLLLMPGVGERLLASKLQILSGTGTRRPSAALSVLTGQLKQEDLANVSSEPVFGPPLLTLVASRSPRHYVARTVYLSQADVHDIDRIIDAWRQIDPRRLTRSAVLRRAVEHLRAAVEADPAKFLLESE